MIRYQTEEMRSLKGRKMVFKKERKKFVIGLGSRAVGFWLASTRPLRWALAQDNKPFIDKAFPKQYDAFHKE
ncbi:hypothetical protein QUF90_22300 [Desulfococcaceae bacterium HSG9]|nr:hypothetical protein [Desulfococcaceae bacterium HSG9]